ncbi:MAG: STAS-like domain-containing protein [Treponema sp.]|nr:STAS-like domain-containing protein [Treponema sp.]
MIVSVCNFGDILMSRPAGREAFLMAKAYVFKEIKNDEEIILDFKGVKVLAPSWADELIKGLKSEYPNIIQYINTENPSVKASLRTVLRSTTP